MLYQKSNEKFKQEQFENPPAEYRGAPFWAWNCRLDKEFLLEELEQFEKMGMGGAHIHCRVGLDTPYLGEAFFDAVEACEQRLKQKGQLCWLYDEDRWPSGSAGGFVTQEEQNRMRFLVFEPAGQEEEKQDTYMAAAKAVRGTNRKLLGCYYIKQDKQGYLTDYRQLTAEERSLVKTVPVSSMPESDGVSLWNAWLEVSGNTPWFNNQSYVNTLDKNAIARFIEITHEGYYQKLGEDFGTVIPAIFTDEPQMAHKERLSEPFEQKPVILPYTDDFDETFQKKYGLSILDYLPELIWEKKETVSQARYFYHRHLCERFSEAYGDQIGAWCKEHGIYLTGHMMNEWTLHSQTMAAGEVMRPMMQFGIPGMDMLCDRRELSTAKQAQSVAHQMGREGVMSEIYGVTGWTFDFRNHKLAGDWQAALGVTLRVPHLSWVSMEGEAKRDYPASIGYQSPWYKEYSLIENHFARLNTALTRGKARVRIGVIHPIESYWLYWGNQRQNADARKLLDSDFENLISWLLYGLLDFDFISEAMLSELTERGQTEGEGFQVGCSRYEVILVPNCRTLRISTCRRLEEFRKSGGKVVFLGELPNYIDGKKNAELQTLVKGCERIAFQKDRVLECLEPFRDVDVWIEWREGEDASRIKHRETGSRTDNMFYQIRMDGEEKWLFLCHVNRPVNEDITFMERLSLSIYGEYEPVLYDTLQGTAEPLKAEWENGKTKLHLYAAVHDSFLLRLYPKASKIAVSASQKSPVYTPLQNADIPKQQLPEPQKFMLDEENCLLLDMAEYKFDDGEWQGEEELLRIDNEFRRRLGYPLRMEALAQPWLVQEEECREHVLKLRFSIDCQTAVEETILALERPEDVLISLNGRECTKQDCGFYVDRSIRKIKLGTIRQGKNELLLQIPFGRKTNIEWCYLLGYFGVQVRGRKTEIVPYPEQLYYGDYTLQGLPFYAGNLIYETDIYTEQGHLMIEISRYRGALVQIAIDGEKRGNLIFAPYRLDLGMVSAGSHHIQIKIFGNRANAFGPVHHADDTEQWYGPNLWRTTGNKWSYEYQLVQMGILTTPRYWIENKNEDEKKENEYE